MKLFFAFLVSTSFSVITQAADDEGCAPNPIVGPYNCPCPEGSLFNASGCFCPAYSELNTEKTACVCNKPFGKIVSYGWRQTNECEAYCICPDGAIWDGTTCVCPENSKLNAAGTACECFFGMSFRGYKCMCPKAMKWDDKDMKCVCTDGATVDEADGVCKCIGDLYWNTSKSQCQCPRYSVGSGNSCACPSGSKMKMVGAGRLGQCQCDSKLQHLQYDQNTRTYQCI